MTVIAYKSTYYQSYKRRPIVNVQVLLETHFSNQVEFDQILLLINFFELNRVEYLTYARPDTRSNVIFVIICYIFKYLSLNYR